MGDISPAALLDRSAVRLTATAIHKEDAVRQCGGIAAASNGHLSILAALAQILLEPDRADALRNAESFDDVIRMLASDDEESDDRAEESLTS
jgi:mannitol PTS system EIIA component